MYTYIAHIVIPVAVWSLRRLNAAGVVATEHQVLFSFL